MYILHSKQQYKRSFPLKQLALTNEFTEFLQNTELLSKAHSHKTIVHLDDIYVYPELAKYDDLAIIEKLSRRNN